MLTPHEAHNNDLGRDLPKRENTSDSVNRPMMDREVPLPGMEASSDPAMLAIHQWLDGDLAEADARRADAKQVAMWNRVAVDTDQRRRMTTPTHVAANIMAALPAATVSARSAVNATATSTSTASLSHSAQATGMSMPVVFAVGTALFAVGIAVGKLFF